MKLYEIDAMMWQIESIEDLSAQLIDEETGEVLRDKATGEPLTGYMLLDQLRMTREDKMNNMVRMIKNEQAEAAAISTELAHLKERRDSLMKKVEQRKKYIAYVQTDETGETHKFSCAAGDVTFRRTQSVNVTNEELLPDALCSRKIVSAPNKIAIKAAILQGQKVPGAELVETKAVLIK